MFRGRGLGLHTFFQDQQNAPTSRVGDGVKHAIQRSLRGHENYRYRGNRWVSMYKLLLQDRAVAISDQPRAYGLGFLHLGERSKLHAKQLVGGG